MSTRPAAHRSWHPWVTLSLLADAFLVVVARTEPTQYPPPPGVIALTRIEINRLFAVVVLRAAADHRNWLRWSWWRRRHQARA